jgi:hypothetical protein
MLSQPPVPAVNAKPHPDFTHLNTELAVHRPEPKKVEKEYKKLYGDAAIAIHFPHQFFKQTQLVTKKLRDLFFLILVNDQNASGITYKEIDAELKVFVENFYRAEKDDLPAGYFNNIRHQLKELFFYLVADSNTILLSDKIAVYKKFYEELKSSRIQGEKKAKQQPASQTSAAAAEEKYPPLPLALGEEENSVFELHLRESADPTKNKLAFTYHRGYLLLSLTQFLLTIK